MDRIEKALENHKKGYNCAQAVACAFCDAVGVDEEAMFRMTEGFGLGMGSMQGTCGAVSGAVALCGLKNSSANLDKPDSKQATYKLSKEIITRFEEMNQSSRCRDLKGVDTKKVLRTCDGCIEDAAKLAQEVLGL